MTTFEIWFFMFLGLLATCSLCWFVYIDRRIQEIQAAEVQEPETIEVP